MWRPSGPTEYHSQAVPWQILALQGWWPSTVPPVGDHLSIPPCHFWLPSKLSISPSLSPYQKDTREKGGYPPIWGVPSFSCFFGS